jgi:glycosyltransferase involved in cell wall biosynthesis
VSRLLAVSPLSGIAGGERLLLRLLPRLASRGWRVRLAVPGRGALRDAARDAGIHSTVLPIGPPERRTAASYAGAAMALLPAARADVAFLNGLSTQRVVPALRLVRGRAVLHVNNPVEETPRAWGRPGFWDVVRVVLCDTDYTAGQCLEAGAPEDRVEVAMPGAWGGQAPPEASRLDGQAVGFVGQIEPRKGVAELVEAAGRFLAGRPGATLTVIGEAPPGAESYEARVRELASRSPASERIRLTGFVRDPALGEFSLVAVPSLAEPYGTVAAEAAAAGVPVVATRTGGLPEVVLDGETGVLVEPGDPSALAGAMGDLLDDPARRRELGGRARESARRFDPETYAERVAELLERARAGGP